MPQKTSALRYENIKHLLYHSTVNKQSTGFQHKKTAVSRYWKTDSGLWSLTKEKPYELYQCTVFWA